MTWLPHALGWLLVAATLLAVVAQGDDDLGRRVILTVSVGAALALLATFVTLATA